jgi:hypothetical protein
MKIYRLQQLLNWGTNSKVNKKDRNNNNNKNKENNKTMNRISHSKIRKLIYIKK